MKSTLCIVMLVVFGFGSFAYAQMTINPSNQMRVKPISPPIKGTRYSCPTKVSYEVLYEPKDDGAWIGQKWRFGPWTRAHLDDVEVKKMQMVCKYRTDQENYPFALVQDVPEGATCVAKKVSVPMAQMYFECTNK